MQKHKLVFVMGLLRTGASMVTPPAKRVASTRCLFVDLCDGASTLGGEGEVLTAPI